MNKMVSLLILGLFLFIPWVKGGKELMPLAVIQIVIFIAGLLCLLKDKGFPFNRSSRINFPLAVLVLFSLLSIIYSVYVHNSLFGFINLIALIMLYRMFVYSTSGSLNGKLIQLIFLLAVALSMLDIFFKKNFFPNPNLLAGYLVIGIIICLSKIILELKDWLYDGKYWQILFLNFLPCLLMTWSLLRTHSRAGYISLFVAVVLLVIIRYRKWGLIALSVLLVLSFILIPSAGIRRAAKLDSPDPYANKRPLIWKNSVKMIMEHPFLGTGLGNFEYGFRNHNFPVQGALAQYGKYSRFAHNEFLQLAAEAGLIPLIMLLWIIGVFFISGIKKINIIKDNRKVLWHYLVSITGVAAILTHALVGFNLHLPAISTAFAFFVSIVMREEDSRKFRCLPGTPVLSFLAISVMLFIVTCNLSAHILAKGDKWGRAVKYAPLNAEYFRKLGDNIQPDKEKLQVYSKMISLHPTESEYHQILGNYYYSREPADLINALKEYKLAVKYNSRNPFYLFNLGSYYFHQGEFRKALKIYREGLLIEPYYVNALYRAGECYWSLDEKEEARKFYNKIIKLRHIIPHLVQIDSPYEKRLTDFDYALVYNSYGKYWRERSNPDQAMVYYQKAKEVNPAFAEVYNNIAGIHFSRRAYSLAVKYISKAIEMDSSNELYRKNMRMITETKAQVEK